MSHRPQGTAEAWHLRADAAIVADMDLAPPMIAAWQGGVFTAAQAVQAGLTQRQVRYRLRTGRWHQVVGLGLSATPRPATGWRAEALAHAATLTWGDSVIGHQVAGALLGFPISATDLAGPVHVYTRLKHDRREGLVVHLRDPLPPAVQLPARGLVLTDVLTTVTDCLAVMSSDAALDLCAWLTSHARLTFDDLGGAVRERFGRPGVTALRRLQRRTAGGAVSEAERRVHEILRKGGITGWVAGARVRDAQGIIGVVDILFPHERIVIEIDGRRAHSDPARFEQDRRRQNRLVLAGYIVLRYTWQQIVTDPGSIAAEVRRTLQDCRRTRAK